MSVKILRTLILKAEVSLYLLSLLEQIKNKLRKISVTPKFFKKVKTNIDSSKLPGLDSFPEVVLKNCEPELLYILTELFNMCLKDFCFPNCWKISKVVSVFKNVGERSTANKSSQEYPVNAGVPQVSILGHTLFVLSMNNLPDGAICNIAIYADDTTLYSKCDKASDLW